ncbi:hypothetical protein PtA15_10A290 [Puccinia triticina]|uniref:GPI-anchored wall transfer protein 1 n=1 Tax=Puccinia triticina TaxID=208348 RepID=A0ABY7CW53_9BASI|nr:uncharacterized protein PtA15_10A290 [Puccinia triticina]WAQ88869.1 hypothetical protein PtA15_10A290 [Puccinia triticina]
MSSYQQLPGGEGRIRGLFRRGHRCHPGQSAAHSSPAPRPAGPSGQLQAIRARERDAGHAFAGNHHRAWPPALARDRRSRPVRFDGVGAKGRGAGGGGAGAAGDGQAPIEPGAAGRDSHRAGSAPRSRRHARLQPPLRFHQPFLTVYRVQLVLLTALSILAVDFTIFPRKFAMTESWGISLVSLVCSILLEAPPRIPHREAY